MTDAHDQARRRRVRTVLLVGPACGVLSAAGLAMAGFGGRTGFASLVLFTAVGSISAGLAGVALAILDEARRRPVSRRRVGQIAACFALTVWCILVLMALG